MLLAAVLALAPPALAQDLEVEVIVPHAPPVRTTLLDAKPGSTQTIRFLDEDRGAWELSTTVETPTDPSYPWRVHFVLSRQERGTMTPVVSPTMQGTGAIARFWNGRSEAVPESPMPAVYFQGYVITWEVE